MVERQHRLAVGVNQFQLLDDFGGALLMLPLPLRMA